MNRTMNSLLVTHFSNEKYEEDAFEVLTTQPQRTLIEKILLLHEEYNRDDHTKMRTERISRHYYDLFQISKHDFFLETLNNIDFIEEVIFHRKHYSRLNRFDYNTLKIGSINIIPSVKILKALEQDYEIMRSEMIYGNPPVFDEIIKVAKKLQDEINDSNNKIVHA